MKKNKPELYTEKQLNALEKHIETYFGKYDHVLHEICSPDIHVDIAVINPTEERRWLTLVTMGMGAHRMNVPEELRENKLERAELVICLPEDWDINSSEKKYYWPITLLKVLARLPIAENTWIGWGHSIDNDGTFAENTDLCSSMLLSTAIRYDDDSSVCRLSDKDEINFYQIIPLYDGECMYKIECGIDDLLDKLAGKTGVTVDPFRIPVVSNFTDVIDWKGWHCGSVIEKEIPIDRINGYNHMAIYLRWCIENNMLNDEFEEFFAEQLKEVRDDPWSYDLREMIKHELCGIFDLSPFNDEGTAFTQYYYDHFCDDDAPCYPADIDNHALEYFGEERYESDEFYGEAYLFVPYDEQYYQDMKKCIDYNYAEFKKMNENKD